MYVLHCESLLYTYTQRVHPKPINKIVKGLCSPLNETDEMKRNYDAIVCILTVALRIFKGNNQEFYTIATVIYCGEIFYLLKDRCMVRHCPIVLRHKDTFIYIRERLGHRNYVYSGRVGRGHYDYMASNKRKRKI